MGVERVSVCSCWSKCRTRGPAGNVSSSSLTYPCTTVHTCYYLRWTWTWSSSPVCRSVVAPATTYPSSYLWSSRAGERWGGFGSCAPLPGCSLCARSPGGHDICFAGDPILMSSPPLTTSSCSSVFFFSFFFSSFDRIFQDC